MRTQATKDAFAMSRPAARDTTVSIAIDLHSPLPSSRSMWRWSAKWEMYRLKSLTHVLKATIQGTYPGSRVRFRTGS